MHSEREVGFEYGKMIGRSLISAIASITSRVNSFGTVADANDAGRPYRLHRVDEGGYRLPVLRERLLEVREIRARGDNEATDVEQRVATSCLADIHSLHSHGLADQFRNAGSSRAAA